jgi:tripartite ATP-independent transporter DctM subunit
VTVVLLFVLLVIGLPIGFAFALVVVANAKAWNIELEGIAAIPFDNISNFPLLAIPLFLLGGELMNRGGLIAQLTAVCDAFMRWTRAPLGYVMVVASALMGAITGSSVATVAAIGGTVGSQMAERGYPRAYTAALNASAGLLGVLIPPSIPLILYGSIVGVSITQLFLASLAPGIAMMIIYLGLHAMLSRRILPDGKEKRSGPEGRALPAAAVTGGLNAATIFRATPALFLPFLVLGGIYSGVFTPTEAAAVAAMYALLITLIGRTTLFGDLPEIFSRAAVASASILVIIAFTGIFNRAMVLELVPQSIAAFATGFTENPLVFLLVVNAVLLAIGMFMETNAATLLMGPLLAPAAQRYGIDPIHFGIILVTNIELGLLTPPMAANLYVAARTNGANVVGMMRHLVWFLGGTLVLMAVITYVPQLSLWYRYFI